MGLSPENSKNRNHRNDEKNCRKQEEKTTLREYAEMLAHTTHTILWAMVLVSLELFIWFLLFVPSFFIHFECSIIHHIPFFFVSFILFVASFRRSVVRNGTIVAATTKKELCKPSERSANTRNRRRSARGTFKLLNGQNSIHRHTYYHQVNCFFLNLFVCPSMSMAPRAPVRPHASVVCMCMSFTYHRLRVVATFLFTFGSGCFIFNI